MSKYLTLIQVSTCKHLLFLKEKYLGVGLDLLKDECEKSNTNNELVCSLCEFITVTRNIVLFFIELIKREEDGKVKVTATEASYIKLYLKLFKETKQVISDKFNYSVELH